ncbi:hypothetical protein ACWGJX_11260 [Streptomyces sp. NPDC054775]
MSDWFLQQGYGVRFEWGPTGAQQLAQDAACPVVVDVLSFTTSVTVAVEAGTRVFPYAWRDETASAFARSKAAALAVGRRAATSTSPWSLSPPAPLHHSGKHRSPLLKALVALSIPGIPARKVRLVTGA